MRIGLDLTHCYQRRGGLQRYAISLTQALLALDSQNEYVLFCRREVPPELVNAPARKIVSPITHQVLNEQLWLLFASLRADLDLFHLTGFAGPVLYPRHSVCTMADVTPFLFRETVKRSQAMYWRWLMPVSARRCNRIITISNESKNDICRVLGVEPSKIGVTYLAAAPFFRVINDIECFEKVQWKYELPQDFALMVSTIEPRKNHIMAIQAFIRAAPHAPRLHLVLTGRLGWLYQPLLEIVRRHELTERVHFLGGVPDEDLVVLYNMARFLVYPSLYEGFGLPILEAMICGCPVLTSNVSSMPEIAGDAAMLVSPSDVEVMTDAFLRMLDRDFANDLREKGFRRASLFSWALTAARTLEIYSMVIDGMASLARSCDK